MKTKKRETMVAVIVRLPRPYLARAEEIGRTEIRSLSSVLRLAVMTWIDQHDKRAGK